MKIHAGAVLKTLNGQPFKVDDKDLTLGLTIAEALATYEQGGKMKSYILAQKFFNDEEVEVDAADLAIVRRAIDACKSYNNLVLGQALAELEKAD